MSQYKRKAKAIAIARQQQAYDKAMLTLVGAASFALLLLLVLRLT
jgi:hypothetical protein